MIDRAWNHLEPQMIEHINDLRVFGYTYEEITEMLSNRHHWTEAPIFKNIDFHYEHARFTMTQLCNMVELLTGDDTDFAEGLRRRIVALVENREILDPEHPDQQRALNFEHEGVAIGWQ